MAPGNAAVCPAHGKPWVPGEHFGRRRCEFYIPEFGVSEDYGCPQALEPRRRRRGRKRD